MTAPTSMKTDIPQWPAAARYSTAGIHTMAAPPAGSSARMPASTPNTTGDGMPAIAEADADEDALEDRRKADAIEHAARHARQVIEELLAMIFGHGNQPLQPVEHAGAVAQEEEQQEQHEEEADQCAERSEHHAAADRRHAAQRRFRRAPQPFLDVGRRHQQLFACEARQRADHRVLLETHEDAAIQLEIAAAHVMHQRACLVHELEGQECERREQCEGREARDHARRHARACRAACASASGAAGGAGRRGKSPRPWSPRRAEGPAACRRPPARRARRKRLLCRTPRAPLRTKARLGALIYVSARGGSIAGEEDLGERAAVSRCPHRPATDAEPLPPGILLYDMSRKATE